MSLYAYPLVNVGKLSERTDEGFRQQLVAGSLAHGYNPDFIAATMSVESGFRPGIRNLGGSSAAGLIQFWKSYFKPVCTRANMDVSWEGMQKLTATEQLPLVFAYFDGTRLSQLGASATVGDYYMAVFMPALIGASPSTLLGSADGQGVSSTKLSLKKVYEQNRGLDRDKDGKITVGDVQRTVTRALNAGLARPRLPTEVVPYLKGRSASSRPRSRRTLYLATAAVGALLLSAVVL